VDPQVHVGQVEKGQRASAEQPGKQDWVPFPFSSLSSGQSEDKWTDSSIFWEVKTISSPRFPKIFRFVQFALLGSVPHNLTWSVIPQNVTYKIQLLDVLLSSSISA
jgi:hypothetical protein